jgi:hypothetical protein
MRLEATVLRFVIEAKGKRTEAMLRFAGNQLTRNQNPRLQTWNIRSQHGGNDVE